MHNPYTNGARLKKNRAESVHTARVRQANANIFAGNSGPKSFPFKILKKNKDNFLPFFTCSIFKKKLTCSLKITNAKSFINRFVEQSQFSKRIGITFETKNFSGIKAKMAFAKILWLFSPPK